MKNTLIVESNKNGKKFQKAYNYLNPNATDEALESFATMTSALSTNEYQGAYLVTKRKTDGSEPYIPGGASTITIAGDTVTVTVEAEPKDIPSLTLGGWSIADSIYSAVVSYSGDGELSANVGSISNGTLTVEDADGTFNGVITAAEGASSAATKLYFDFDTNTVTQTVQAAASYNSSVLDKVLQGGIPFAPKETTTFLHGRFTPNLVYPLDGTKYLRNEEGGTIVTLKNWQVPLGSFKLYKYREDMGFSLHDSGGHHFLNPFALNENATAKNTDTSANGCQDLNSYHNTDVQIVFTSLCDPYVVCYLGDYTAPNNTGDELSATRSSAFKINPETPSSSEYLFHDSYYENIYNSKTNVCIWCYRVMGKAPVITPSGDSVTIAAGSDEYRLPIFLRDGVAYTFSGRSSQLDSYTLTDNIWLTDDDNVPLGFFYNKSKTDTYIITYKPGTYSKDTYLSNAFNVWGFYFDGQGGATLYKNTAKLPDILDDVSF